MEHPKSSLTVQPTPLSSTVPENQRHHHCQPCKHRIMLKTNFDNYPKGIRFISLLEDFVSRGIFNSDGEVWKAQKPPVTSSMPAPSRTIIRKPPPSNYTLDSYRFLKVHGFGPGH
ncbi:cytochrome P450 [Cynara cardunculus var. scolymus]|uniref:Cytochrome P450 n=1 Tax=Cynara cardunculus var. scolymus TaxID=59895 RepID=A0A124SEQ1_CYNCS|nr:cytochrome P450 [Cynara cardunculus var. scolymus]